MEYIHKTYTTKKVAVFRLPFKRLAPAAGIEPTTNP